MPLAGFLSFDYTGLFLRLLHSQVLPFRAVPHPDLIALTLECSFPPPCAFSYPVSASFLSELVTLPQFELFWIRQQSP